MPNYNPSKARSFLLELILALLIFAACATIALQVFAQAHNESSRSAAITQLSREAQQRAEHFKAGYNNAESLSAVLGVKSTDDTIISYYNRDLQKVEDVAQAYYTLTCSIDSSRPVKEMLVTLTEDSAILLFEYNVKSYSAQRGAAS